MTPISNYKRFLTELVRQHMAILGPNIARDMALGVPGIKIDATGDVIEIVGNPPLVMQSLVNQLSELSEPVTQLVLYELFNHYPDIKGEYSQPLEKIRLTCALVSGDKI